MELFTATSPFPNHQLTTVPVWAQNSSLQTRLHMTSTSENYPGVNLLTYLLTYLLNTQKTCCMVRQFSWRQAVVRKRKISVSCTTARRGFEAFVCRRNNNGVISAADKCFNAVAVLGTFAPTTLRKTFSRSSIFRF